MTSKEVFLNYLDIYAQKYDGNRKKVNSIKICNEIKNLISYIPKNYDGIDEFCKCISTNCIMHNINWEINCFNLIIKILLNCITNIKIKKEKNKILCCLRTIGHLIFERSKLLNNKNKKKLLYILINFIEPNLNLKLFINNNELNELKNNNEVNVNKLLNLYYNYIINKRLNKNNKTYDNILNNLKNYNKFYLFIKNEIKLHKNNINILLKEIWKFLINIKKLSIICLAHCIVKTNNIFDIYNEIICYISFKSFHFFKKELYNYNISICLNDHDYAKSITPILRSLSLILTQINFNKYNIINDLFLQIMDDLKDIMVMGTNSFNINTVSNKKIIQNIQQNNTTTTTSQSDNDNNSNNDRNRYRNKVLIDWDGQQFKSMNGYTSEKNVN